MKAIWWNAVEWDQMTPFSIAACYLWSWGGGGCIRCVTPGVEKGGTLFSEFSSARWAVVLLTLEKERKFT